MWDGQSKGKGIACECVNCFGCWNDSEITSCGSSGHRNAKAGVDIVDLAERTSSSYREGGGRLHRRWIIYFGERESHGASWERR